MAKRPPQSSLVVNAMAFKHTKYPNACKEYLRFMMEAPQYAPWLAGCLGYWSNSLKNYGKMAFWNADPRLKPYIDSMDTPYTTATRGLFLPRPPRWGPIIPWSTCSPRSPPAMRRHKPR